MLINTKTFNLYLHTDLLTELMSSASYGYVTTSRGAVTKKVSVLLETVTTSLGVEVGEAGTTSLGGGGAPTSSLAGCGRAATPSVGVGGVEGVTTSQHTLHDESVTLNTCLIIIGLFIAFSIILILTAIFRHHPPACIRQCKQFAVLISAETNETLASSPANSSSDVTMACPAYPGDALSPEIDYRLSPPPPYSFAVTMSRPDIQNPTGAVSTVVPSDIVAMEH